MSKQITVSLDEATYRVLRQEAAKQLRTVRDQASISLMRAIGTWRDVSSRPCIVCGKLMEVTPRGIYRLYCGDRCAKRASRARQNA